VLVEALIELLLIYHLNQIKTNSKISFTRINSLPDTMQEDDSITTIEDTIMENKNASKDDTILKNANN